MNYHLDTNSREPSGQDPLGSPKGDACNKQEQGHQESGRTAAEGEGRPEDLSIPAKRGSGGLRACSPEHQRSARSQGGKKKAAHKWTATIRAAKTASRIHRHHLFEIVVEVLLHARHEHHGLNHHVDLLVTRVVTLRHVVRPPDAEEHHAEIVLQRPRLRLEHNVCLEDEVTHRRAAGIETAILYHDDAGRVAVAVGELLENAVANLSCLEEDAALMALEHRPVHDFMRAFVGEDLPAVNGQPPLADALDGVRDDVDVVLLRCVHAAQIEVRLRAVVVLHLAVADAPPRP